MFDVDISKGYVDMPVPEGIDLVSEIERMKREKNAVVLAHYYQSGDLQDLWLWLNGLRKQMLPYWCFVVFILWARPPKLFVPTRKY